MTVAHLFAMPNPSVSGQAVKLTAYIDAFGGFAARGSVGFTDDGAALGTATLATTGTAQAVLSTGLSHACALANTGTVKCWGDNANGEIGDATTTARPMPVNTRVLPANTIAVSAGRFFTCALITTHGVRCWGFNGDGELGDGTTTQRLTPMSLPGISNVVAIATGDYHACALISTGRVKCWGYNTYGELGDGTTTQRLTGTFVSGLTNAVAISAGQFHTCALTAAGAVQCWGSNLDGQLGDGTQTQRTVPVTVSGLASGVTAIASGTKHNCAILSGGGLKCWGSNVAGQIGNGDMSAGDALTPVNVVGLSTGVAAVSAGYVHTCALTTAGAIKCWGDNYFGEIGDGTETQRYTPVGVSGLSNGMAGVAAGNYFSCGQTTFGTVKCWGSNHYAQLGDGSGSDHSDVPVLTQPLVGLNRARAQFTTSSLVSESHTLGADFAGDTRHSGSSDTYAQTVR